MITNNRRLAGIICLFIMVFTMIAPVAYAANDDNVDTSQGNQTAKALNLTQSYPEAGDNHLQMENSGIKLFFDGNVIDESVWETNKNAFTLSTKDGKKNVPIRAYSNKASGNNYILVVVDKGQPLESKTEYIFTVKSGLRSQEGQVLSEDIVLDYTTVDMEGNTRINMILMGVMVVGMIVMTVFSNKRQEKKETEKKEEKLNPYKIAKEKGKSVEEVMAQLEKEKARKERKAQKKLKGDSSDDMDEDDDTDVYKVKAPRPISAAGSTYKTGKKALAEKKAKEEEAKKAKGTTNPKNKKGGKKKGKKK